MDTRSDPLGVCTHRSSFIDARVCLNLSSPPTSQKKSAVDSSGKHMVLGQTIACSTDDGQGDGLRIAGSITGGSTSTTWSNADRSSRALTPPRDITLSKRSRSCNDLVETSATIARIYNQKSGTLRPRSPDISWTHNLRETDVDGRSSKSQPADLPHHGPNDSKVIKAEDHSPSQEIRDVKTHVMCDQFTQLGKDETEPTQVLLGLSSTIQPINEPRVSTAVSRTPRETMKIKKKDDEVLSAASCITSKNGTMHVGTVIYTRNIVDEAGGSSHRGNLKTPPRSFDAYEWSSFIWSPTIFTPQDHFPSSRTGVDTSEYTDRSDGQVDTRPKPTRTAASSSNSPDGSEDLKPLNNSPSQKPRKSAASSSNGLNRSEDLNTSASPFISALDMFNEIVPNCDSKKIRPNIDAMERFQRDKTKCLGNTQKGIKCCNPICSQQTKAQQTKAIEKLLTKLAAQNFVTNTQNCVAELLKLTKMAVCFRQRKKVENKVSELVAPDIHKEEEAIKVKSPLNGLDRSEDLRSSASPSVSALDKFNEIVPNSNSKKSSPSIDALKRFQEEPACCLANDSKGSRCHNPIAAKNQQAVEDLLTQLAGMNIEKSTQECIIELDKLIAKAVCWRQRPEVLLKLGPPIPLDLPKDTARPSAGPTKNKKTTKVKGEKLTGRNLIRGKSKTTGGQKAPAVSTSIANPTFRITNWWPKTPKLGSSYLPRYYPFYTEIFRKSDVRPWVMKQAEKFLTPRERKAGYLYVYWNKATFGAYKIGFTTLNVDKRLQEWESQCKHTAQKQYQSPFEVRNVERLEKLVHAELKEFRVKEYGCHGCGRNHEEWFEGVGFEVILKSIEFWTKWIMKEPYKKVKGEWLLKEDAKKGLPQLCNMLSVHKAEESKAKSITITAHRHNLRPRMARMSSSSYSRANW